MAGYVTLVGAGCGPDLITVRGLKAVRNADVILYDDLISPEILSEAKTGAELVYVGKRAGRDSIKQEEITELLIRYAANGDRKFHVVRLKGGDGFVFGRGGEEMLALREAGVPCEIIPGVSSAIAVPEEFGIPVTHRGIARSFTVITGHTAGNVIPKGRKTDPEEETTSEGKETPPAENYAALASLQGTLVFLMGLRAVPKIAEELIKHGKAGDTPAAILVRGFAPDAERITGTLATIGELSKSAKTPAIFVVGETAAMNLESTIRRPLEGVRITVTGTKSMTGRLADLLTDVGAKVQRKESLMVLPQPENIPAKLGSADVLVFTSPNGVRIFRDAFIAGGGDVRSLSGLKFAVIGPGTARALAEFGIRADFMPEDYTGKALGRELVKRLAPGGKVLLLRAEDGGHDLTDELDKAGVSFRDCGIYRTEAACNVREAENRDESSDYIVFCSGSGVRAWFDGRGEIPQGTIPVCIGPSTEEELRRHTDQPCITARPHTAEGIRDTLIYSKTQRSI